MSLAAVLGAASLAAVLKVVSLAAVLGAASLAPVLKAVSLAAVLGAASLAAVLGAKILAMSPTGRLLQILLTVQTKRVAFSFKASPGKLNPKVFLSKLFQTH